MTDFCRPTARSAALHAERGRARHFVPSSAGRAKAVIGLSSGFWFSREIENSASNFAENDFGKFSKRPKILRKKS
jgi:hypothetical protein